MSVRTNNELNVSVSLVGVQVAEEGRLMLLAKVTFTIIEYTPASRMSYEVTKN